MEKLALIALLLGACVAEDPSTSARGVVETAPPADVVDGVENPTLGDNHIDVELVLVTGLQLPGREASTEHIDLTKVNTATLGVTVRELCALVDELPISDVCGYLCQPESFAARLFGSNTGDCNEQRCALPGGGGVQVLTCVSGG